MPGGSVGINSAAPTSKFDIAPGGNSFIKFGQDADNPKIEIFRSTGNASNTHYSVELQQILGDFIFSTAAAANSNKNESPRFVACPAHTSNLGKTKSSE